MAQPTQPAADHRRATAERNVAAILDAAERLLQRGAPLTIAAVSGEAGVSRVTVYAHFAGLPELVAAVVERSVGRADAALRAADLGSGPADAALDRLVEVGWRELDSHHAVAGAAAEQLSSEQLRSSHERVGGTIRALLVRGRADGSFRDDLTVAWLATCLLALMHAAGDDVRAERISAADALHALRLSAHSLVAGRPFTG
jgi:AcrR family transcriptional regulator